MTFLYSGTMIRGRVVTVILSLCMVLHGGQVFAATSRLHIRQAASWSQSLTSETDWSTALSVGYSDCNLFILGGVRQQAPNTDIGVIARFGLGSHAWAPNRYVDGHGDETYQDYTGRKVSYPAILTIQTHLNVHQDAGTCLDIEVSAGQDLRTKDPRNWWGLSYSLGVHSSLSFSPYLDRPLVNFNPTVLLSASKAFAGRVFLELYCNTNTLFWYTSQLSFTMGGSVSCRLTDHFLLGLSGKARFADLPTETGFITMGEVTLFLNWQDMLP